MTNAADTIPTRGMKVARADAAALGRSRMRRERKAIGELSDAKKVAILGRAIVTALEKRGSFVTLDGVQAGLAEADVERLRDLGMAHARTLDPDVCAMAGQ